MRSTMSQPELGVPVGDNLVHPRGVARNQETTGPCSGIQWPGDWLDLFANSIHEREPS